jgi:hypothetical protein
MAEGGPNGVFDREPFGSELKAELLRPNGSGSKTHVEAVSSLEDGLALSDNRTRLSNLENIVNYDLTGASSQRTSGCLFLTSPTPLCYPGKGTFPSGKVVPKAWKSIESPPCEIPSSGGEEEGL